MSLVPWKLNIDAIIFYQKALNKESKSGNIDAKTQQHAICIVSQRLTLGLSCP